MRKIDKKSEPVEHRTWRSKFQGDINYGYNLMDSGHRKLVKGKLLEEQGNICAYTGRAITADSSHIEHLLPQKAWKAHHGLEVTYRNMVACWPVPGHKPEPEYGARFKDNWPKPGQESKFVSPLTAGCEKRFIFNFRGEVSTQPKDKAAAETVKKLGLDKEILADLRQIEIVNLLGKDRSLKLKDAKLRLRELEESEAQLKTDASVQLRPYCFALKQALRRHIHTLEMIRKSAKRKK